MKKIFLGLAVLASALTSCDMDTTRYGVISTENGIETVADAERFLNGIYINLRGTSAGTQFAAPDIQMDQFVGTISNGNRLGTFSTGQIVVSDQDITGWYESFYNGINSVNYFIPRVEAIIENTELSEEQKAQLNSFIGEAHFARAFYYSYLFDKFVDYKEADLDAPGKGLQLVTVYNPSGNRLSYVGRSTIRETVTYINAELTAAFDALRAWETSGEGHFENVGPNSGRVCSYTVEALQARMALLSKDYATALAKAEDVINSEEYALCGIDTYQQMWVNDEGDELIFVPNAIVGNGGIGIGVNWLQSNAKNCSDYLPTAATLLAYGEGDIRMDSFFEFYAIEDAGINAPAYAFSKFPGNPALWSTTSNNLLNKAKPFRLSELYLIAAECCATDGPVKNEAKANAYLNDLRSARIDGYEAVTYNGNALVNAIRAERAKELIGEGFRMSDLRRWGLGFTRTAAYETIGFNALVPYVQNITDNVSYQPGDYRFIWPIPYREMSVNPQLAGQQNPRY